MGKEHIIEQLCWTALLAHQDYAARMVENPGSVKYIEILQICFNTSRTRPKLILPNAGRMSLPVYHRLYLEMLSHAWENTILCLYLSFGRLVLNLDIYCFYRYADMLY